MSAKPPKTFDFPVEDVVSCVAGKFPKNINQIYWFLNGNPNWRRTKKGFAVCIDELVSLKELILARMDSEQLEIVKSLVVIYLFKIHTRNSQTVSDKKWNKNGDRAFRWLLEEAKECFKTITLSSSQMKSE